MGSVLGRYGPVTLENLQTLHKPDEVLVAVVTRGHRYESQKGVGVRSMLGIWVGVGTGLHITFTPLCLSIGI